MRDWIHYLRDRLDLPEMEGQKEERMLLEMADHAEDLYREALSHGSSPEEAIAYVEERLGQAPHATAELTRAEPAHRRAKIRRLLERQEDALRRRRGLLQALGDTMRSLRLSLRVLAKRPAFSGVVILVLSLGIGSSAAIFTFLDAVILSPLPFEDADRLVSIDHTAPDVGIASAGQCAAWHFTYEQENLVFEDLGLFQARSLDLTGFGPPEALPALGVTSGVFQALQLHPTQGRTFTVEDESPDAPGTLLLSHAFWKNRFEADPEIVGQHLRIDGQTAEIIGVMPPSLSTLWPDRLVFFPLRYRQSALYVGNIGYGGLARLKEGVTLNKATADLARIQPMAFEKYPGGPFDKAVDVTFVPILHPLKEDLVGAVTPLLWLLMSGVAVLLLLACANVANLFLLRTEGKRAEMAVRSAVGASPSSLGFEYLKESLILGALGGAGGLVLAAFGLKFLIDLADASIPRLAEVSLNPSVLAFVLAISMGSGFLFGMIPVLRSRRRGWVGALKSEASGGTHPNRRHRLQHALVVSQMALASLLIVAAVLMLRSFQSLADVDPGFANPEEVLTLSLHVPTLEIEDLTEVARTQETIARRLAEIPGVSSVGLATDIPLDGDYNLNTLYISDKETEPAISRRHRWIGEGYLETLQIPLLAGRSITWNDIHTRLPIVLVSAKLAKENWGSVEAALGKRVAIRPSPVHWFEVVGVVANVRDDGPDQPEIAEVYWPQVTTALWNNTTADQAFAWRSMTYVIRSSRVGSPGFLREVHSAVWDVNANLPLRAVHPLSNLMTQSVERTSLSSALLGGAAALALLLGLVGAYAVVSYTVSQRTHELALRKALGAQVIEIKKMVLRRALLLTIIGVAIGLGLALGLTHLMTGLLFGVSPADPVTFLGVAVGLTMTAVAACYIPAQRAAEVDLVAALRSE
ncbi:MAG: ABC transporter permease [Deltaproteobacteria bacterium]|nr:ABC transporter permease [Deltaproteobacteria bacterium]